MGADKEDLSADLARLLPLLAQYGIEAFEYSSQDHHVMVVQGAVQSGGNPPAPALSSVPDPVILTSPGVGRFYQAEGRLPREVMAGEVIGVIAAGRTLQPVVASCSGRLVGSHCADGTGVGYGARLFEIHPATDLPT